MGSAQGRSGPRVAWWEKCQDGGEGSLEKAHHLFFMWMGEQVVLFSHIRCSVNTTGRKKKGMNKCLQQKEAALWFSGKTGTGLSGG